MKKKSEKKKIKGEIGKRQLSICHGAIRGAIVKKKKNGWRGTMAIIYCIQIIEPFSSTLYMLKILIKGRTLYMLKILIKAHSWSKLKSNTWCANKENYFYYKSIKYS